MSNQTYIRKIVRDIFLEAVSTPHYRKRIHDRLHSEYTNFTEEKQVHKDRILAQIEFLNNVNFPGQDNIGIRLGRGSMSYKYEQTTKEGEHEFSAGRIIWVVVRGNDLKTIVFGDTQYTPQNTQIHLGVDRIMDYIFKSGSDGNLSEKDLRKLSTPKQKSTKPYKKKDKPTEPIININGVKYVIDRDKEVAYKKNKPTDKYDLWDFISKLNKHQHDEVYQLLESYGFLH